MGAGGKHVIRQEPLLTGPQVRRQLTENAETLPARLSPPSSSIGLTANRSKALRSGDTLVVWKLDRRGRNLHHLVKFAQSMTARKAGLEVLTS